MKLSWLGKFLLADAAYNVAKNIMKNEHRSNHDGYDEESHFSNIEIKHLMEAVERNDYVTFKQAYTDRRPRDTVERIDEVYAWFQERKRNGWE